MALSQQYFYDAEFIEGGAYRPIHLISLGIRCADGRELYLQNRDCPLDLAGDWLVENVFPHLVDFNVEARVPMDRPRLKTSWVNFNEIGSLVQAFVTVDSPQFYGWYSAYDQVVLAQCFGTLLGMPRGWPKYTRDLKQICDALGNPSMPMVAHCHICTSCKAVIHHQGIITKHCGDEGTVQMLTSHFALDDARWNHVAFEFLRRRYLTGTFILDLFGDRR